MSEELITQEAIESRIFVIRGKRVMIDRDLAELYWVSTKSLNQQVRRNVERFPENFMFQLSKREKTEVVTICDHLDTLRFSPQLPYAFTEHGVTMLASVLNSDRAVKMSIFIVNTFVRLRQLLYTHSELADKLKELEGRVSEHDKDIQDIVRSIKELLTPLPEKGKKIGFHSYPYPFYLIPYPLSLLPYPFSLTPYI